MSDPKDELREEIAQTRADLGDTVEALAAKTDVKARAKHAAADAGASAAATAKEAAATAKDAAATAAATAKDAAASAAATAKGAAATVKDKISETQTRFPVRRPLPWPLIGAAATAVAGVVLLARSRRRP